MANIDEPTPPAVAKPEPPLLHLFGQASQHDEVWVLGNHAGLVALHSAIGEALRGVTGRSQAMTEDGEYYELMVLRDDTAWMGLNWQAALLPYTEYHGMPWTGVAPWQYPEAKQLYADIRAEIARERAERDKEA